MEDTKIYVLVEIKSNGEERELCFCADRGSIEACQPPDGNGSRYKIRETTREALIHEGYRKYIL